MYLSFGDFLLSSCKLMSHVWDIRQSEQRSQYTDWVANWKIQCSTQADEESYLLENTQTGSVPTQPSMRWEADDFSILLKRPEPKADQSFKPSVKVKNKWSYNFNPTIRVCLQHMDRDTCYSLL
jgi:hypothetical protein